MLALWSACLQAMQRAPGLQLSRAVTCAADTVASGSPLLLSVALHYTPAVTLNWILMQLQLGFVLGSLSGVILCVVSRSLSHTSEVNGEAVFYRYFPDLGVWTLVDPVCRLEP